VPGNSPLGLVRIISKSYASHGMIMYVPPYSRESVLYIATIDHNIWVDVSAWVVDTIHFPDDDHLFR
jgi:hypothetical protein